MFLPFFLAAGQAVPAISLCWPASWMCCAVETCRLVRFPQISLRDIMTCLFGGRGGRIDLHQNHFVQNQSTASISSHYFPLLYFSTYFFLFPLYFGWGFWLFFFYSAGSDNTQIDIIQPEDYISVLHHLYFSDFSK